MLEMNRFVVKFMNLVKTKEVVGLRAVSVYVLNSSFFLSVETRFCLSLEWEIPPISIIRVSV